MDLTPHRKAGESAVDYRVRRRAENKQVDEHLRGTPHDPLEPSRPKLGKAETKRRKRERRGTQ